MRPTPIASPTQSDLLARRRLAALATVMRASRRAGHRASRAMRAAGPLVEARSNALDGSELRPKRRPAVRRNASTSPVVSMMWRPCVPSGAPRAWISMRLARALAVAEAESMTAMPSPTTLRMIGPSKG